MLWELEEMRLGGGGAVLCVVISTPFHRFRTDKYMFYSPLVLFPRTISRLR
jgi:hypothetical protein